MKPSQVFWIVLGLALIGFMVPRPEDGAAGGAQAAPAGMVAAADSDRSRNVAWLAGQTVLERRADGHFYADAGIDGARINFLVDTGASFVALTGQDAAAIGLHWDEADLMVVGRGASGAVRGVPVTIDRMEVGGFEARDVRAAIVPEGLDISLLGQSFLQQISNVEISGDEMKLGG